MKSKILKRIGTAGLAVAMTATMSISSFAAAVSYQAPTSPMTADPNLILIAAHAQADVTPEILGLTNTTDRAGEVPNDYSLEKAQSSALIGTFGTNINSSPNPYLYNWAYNSWASENGKTLADKHTLGGISGSPNSEDVQIVESLGTSRSLYYRPEILLGTGNDNGAAYEALIAQLPENTDEDKNNDYNPHIVNYASSRCASFLETLYDLANVSKEIIAADNTKKLRYGDPLEVADSLTEYTVGLQSYVLEQLAKNNAPKKKVAVVDPLHSTDGVFIAVDENTSVQGTTTNSRAGEFVANTTDNIVKTLGKTTTNETVQGITAGKEYYVLTAEEIVKNSDAIVISGVQNQDGDEAAFREELMKYLPTNDRELQAKAESIPIMATRFACCGSIGANSIENLLGLAYWTSFIYSEYLNPVYVATYWYQNFYHISDNNMLSTIIATNLGPASKPKNVSTDISGYSKSDMDAKIQEGLTFYADNQADYADTLIPTYAAYLSKGIDSYATPPVDKVVLDKSSLELTVGASEKLTATVTPENAKDATVIWSSSDESVATVADGTVTAVKAGEAMITATAGGKLTACTVKVSDPAPAKPEFTDVEKDSYYEKAVNWAVENGITNGTTDTTFSPGDSCLRAQAVTFLWRAKGSPKVTDVRNPFTDVQEGSYYYDAVLWAYKNNITTGATDTTFDPTGTCTRGQIVTFLWRTEGSPAASASVAFTDVASDAYYASAVQWAVAKEVTNGMSETRFGPNEDCTRAHIVTFLNRALA